MSKKLLLGYLLLLAFVYALMEIFSLAAFYVTEKKGFSFVEVRSAQEQAGTKISRTAQEALFTLPAVIHPYIGMVQNADYDAPNPTGMKINDYGFFDDKNSVQRRSPDKYIVGIFGGSVAWWFSSLGTQALSEELKKLPEVGNKKIVYVRVALGAFKQPQQLMAFSYLLAQGAEFDMVINLDGFNEVSIPATHNLPKSVNPFYPSYWQELLHNFLSGDEQELLEKTSFYEHTRRLLASAASKAPLRYSVTANTVWTYADRYLSQKVGAARLAFKESKAKDTKVPYLLRGPKFSSSSKEDMYEKLAEHWMRSSLMMKALCKDKGIPYYHFLQPNQYVPGSKPIGEAERKLAFDDTLFWKEQVLNGYPHLITKGNELIAAGESFKDFTQIFAKVEEPLYNDSCCHFNERGNALLGKEIGAYIVSNRSQ